MRSFLTSVPLLLPIISVAGSPDSFESLDDLRECQAAQANLIARLAELETQVRGMSNVSVQDPSIILTPAHPDGPGRLVVIQKGLLAFFFLVLAAVSAGLTMGLASLEPMEMEIIVKSEEKDLSDKKDKLKLQADQRAAARVLPLIKHYHWLLVSLLLMNTVATEALPLILEEFVPFWLVVVLSVILVLMFGEIIPSAMFTTSEQLQVAARFVPFVYICRFVLAPFAWPLAKVLDWLLGKDHKGRYNFAELRAIVGIHAKLFNETPLPVTFKCHDNHGLGIITTETQHNFTEDSTVAFTGISTKLCSDGTKYFVKPCAPLTGRNSTFTFKLYTAESRQPGDLVTFADGELTSGHFTLQERDELRIMHGVMTLTHMTAEAAMVPLDEAWMLEGSQRLSGEVMEQILQSGYSRIPVYSQSKHNVRGFILVKKLTVVSPEDENGLGRCAASLGLDSLVVIRPNMPMLELLNKFQEDRCHLALVTDSPALVKQAWESGAEIPPDVHMAGIITMEDIIEILLQEDIEDEHDVFRRSSLRSEVSSVHDWKSSLGSFTPDTRFSSGASGLEEPLLSPMLLSL